MNGNLDFLLTFGAFYVGPFDIFFPALVYCTKKNLAILVKNRSSKSYKNFRICKMGTGNRDQCDQIGRIFLFWGLKMKKIVQVFWLLFSTVKIRHSM
jgi:hypothetical protein